MNRKVVLITGASGFIGKQLTAHLRRRKWTVIGTVRTRKYEELCKSEATNKLMYLPYDIGETHPAKLGLSAFDAVIHLAHDFSEHMSHTNALAAKHLAEHAKVCGVEKQIYLSSYSARPSAVSSYGRSKYEAEKLVAEYASILRPGLVVGSDGLYKKIAGFVKKHSIVPQIGVTDKTMPLIDVDDLCRVIEVILEQQEMVAHTVYQPSLVSYKTLVKALSTAMHKHRMIIPFPIALIMFGIKTIKLLGIRPPITADNVSAFVHNQKQQLTNDWSLYDRYIKEKDIQSLCNKYYSDHSQ